jgi:hypothetical protein
MYDLSWHEIAVGLIGFVCGCIIAKEYAMNGILELSVQLPPNKKAITSWFFAVISFVIYGFYLKSIGYTPNQWFLGICSSGIPILWGMFYRYVIMPPGLAEYNRARHKTFYWTIKHYVPGKRTPDEAKMLRDFGQAKTALDQFEQAINLQSYGVGVQYRKNISTVYEEMALLYRMMDRLDQAKKALFEANLIASNLLYDDPDDIDLKQLQSLIYFREAEIAHIEGFYDIAKEKYQTSLDLISGIGSEFEIELTKRLLRELS